MPTSEERSNRNNIRAKQKQIEGEFEKVITDLFSKGVRLRMIRDKFSLSDNVSFEKLMERVLNDFKINVEAIILSGIRESIDLSKRNFLQALVGEYGGLTFSETWLKVLSDGYEQVLEQFVKRVEAGLSLSDRVWKITNQLQRDIEYTIFSNLADGKSAQQMSRDLRQYLKNPNALFRRVRNAKGKLVLSKAAREYNPGQGVYRSAYKNAMRVSRVEINTAYRTADHEQYKRMPFVLGIEIRLSDAHPTYDMCDELVGVYPSWFKFTGFHIQCICYQVPILAPREEFEAYQLALLEGKSFTFKNRVTKVPPQAFKWVKDNAKALERWKSKPTFMQDNLAVFGG